MGACSSSTQLLAAFKQRRGTSVPAPRQSRQVLSFHSTFRGTERFCLWRVTLRERPHPGSLKQHNGTTGLGPIFQTILIFITCAGAALRSSGPPSSHPAQPSEMLCLETHNLIFTFPSMFELLGNPGYLRTKPNTRFHVSPHQRGCKPAVK